MSMKTDDARARNKKETHTQKAQKRTKRDARKFSMQKLANY